MGKTYHYTYRIKFPSQGWFYYGVHSTDDLNDGYCGSPHTHKDKWKWFAWEMEILEFHETREIARSVEKRLIAPYLNDSTCLNEGLNGFFSIEAGIRGASGPRSETHITRNSEEQQRKSLLAKQSPKWKEFIKRLTQHNIESGHLEKISQIAAQKQSKAVVAIFPDGEEREYKAVREAARQLNVSHSGISQCISGKQSHVKGIQFKFK